MAAEKSGIDYVDYSVNFWRGCREVSPGCVNCYAKREQRRYGLDPDRVVRTVESTWDKIKKFKAGGRVFVCPWSDFFIDEAQGWRRDAWRIMIDRRDLTWLIVTKRSGAARRFFDDEPFPPFADYPTPSFVEYPNIQLIATVCNQDEANRIIPELLQCKVAVRGVSAEPLLGGINFRKIKCVCEDQEWEVDALGGEALCTNSDSPSALCTGEPRIDQVFVGCESLAGGKAGRFADGFIEAAAGLVAQCREAGVACYVKQAPIKGRVSRNPGEWPEALRIRELI